MKRDPWTAHFDEALRHFDKAVKSVDWRKEDVRHTATENMADLQGRKTHTLTASTWRSRRRMAWLFLWLAWRIVTRGRATVRL